MKKYLIKIVVLSFMVTIFCSCKSTKAQLKDYDRGVGTALSDIKENCAMLMLFSCSTYETEARLLTCVDRSTGFLIRYFKEPGDNFEDLTAFEQGYNSTLRKYINCFGFPKCSYKRFEEIIYKPTKDIEKLLVELPRYTKGVNNFEFESTSIELNNVKVAWRLSVPDKFCGAVPHLHFETKDKVFDYCLSFENSSNELSIAECPENSRFLYIRIKSKNQYDFFIFDLKKSLKFYVTSTNLAWYKNGKQM